MYTIISGFARKPKGNGLWEEIDIANEACNGIYSRYRDVHMNLWDDFQQKNVGLNLMDTIEMFTAFNGNFAQWLESLGNKTLPTEDGHFAIVKTVVEYEDAVKGQFRMTPVSHTGHVDMDLPRGAKDDVLLTKKEIGVDAAYYKEAADHLLVSVGGYFHFTDHSENGIHVIDAMRTLNKQPCPTPTIGLTSFHTVGKMRFIPIKDEMVYKQDIRASLYDKTYLKLNEDISNKTFMIVLGGYLHVMDDKVARLAGNNIIAIDFKHIPLHERLLESMNVLDFDHHLHLEAGSGPLHFDADEIVSDAFLRRYLTMSQSFIIVFDHSDLYIEKHQAQPTKVFGQYLSGVYPNLPMFNGRGRAVEYWAVEEDNLWDLGVYDTTERIDVVQTYDTEDSIAVVGNRWTGHRTKISHPEFWEIGRQSLVLQIND